jgi:hypothetical protein
MNPIIVLVCVVVGLIAACCVSGLLGIWLGKALLRARRIAPKSRVVRFASSYIPWALLAGVLICVIVFGSASGPLVPLVAFFPFLVCLSAADSLEPVVKTCKTCGQSVDPYHLGDEAWRHIEKRYSK